MKHVFFGKGSRHEARGSRQQAVGSSEKDAPVATAVPSSLFASRRDAETLSLGWVTSTRGSRQQAVGSSSTSTTCFSASQLFSLSAGGGGNAARCRRHGYSIFELLAVLTVIGMVLAITLGSFRYWNTIRAINGAEKVVVSGIREARTLAMSQGKYVCFSFGNIYTNNIKEQYAFRILVCTNRSDVIESLGSANYPPDELIRTSYPAAPMQRLNGEVAMHHMDNYDAELRSPVLTDETEPYFFFRPDGTLLQFYTDDRTAPYQIALLTKTTLRDKNGWRRSMFVHICIDPITGIVSSEEVPPQ